MKVECSWQDGAEGDGLPDPGESMLLTYTIRSARAAPETSNEKVQRDEPCYGDGCIAIRVAIRGLLFGALPYVTDGVSSSTMASTMLSTISSTTVN